MGRNDRRPRRKTGEQAKNRSGKPRSGNKKRFNKNRRPQKLTPGRVLLKYQNLMDQYLAAREKFFNVFGFKNAKQVDKAQRNYSMALDNMRNFEKNLEDWQKEILKPQLDAYPEDRQYSTEHDLPQTGDTVSFVGEFEDPHLLPQQKAGAWSEDTEESEGSMEDYYAYKGITPPTPDPIEVTSETKEK